MSRAVIDHNGSVMREIITHGSDPEGTFHVRTAQDVQPVIDLVTTLREVNAHVGHRKSKNMIPVAEAPMQIYEQAFREGWLHDKKKWKLWLNDPDNKVFRITNGRF